MPINEDRSYWERNFLRGPKKDSNGRDYPFAGALAANRLDQRSVYTEFRDKPTAHTNAATAGVPTGSTGDVNRLDVGGVQFECHIKGTQTLIIPVQTAVGLNVALDQTDNDGVELTHGILSRGRASVTVGTDRACRIRVKFKLGDVSGTDDCAVGFRKCEAYQANLDDYDELACLNVISGDIYTETILNNGATSSIDTTSNWADGETHTLEVRVSAAGVVTFYVDDVQVATGVNFTFDAGENICPFLFFLNAADLVDTLELIEWEFSFDPPAAI